MAEPARRPDPPAQALVFTGAPGRHSDQSMLTIPHNITWWKGIEVQDRSGAVRAAAWTSDSPAQHVVVNSQ
jgi:hypothetical protein